MKKIIIYLLLIICVSLPFVGCTRKEGDKNIKESAVQSSKDNKVEKSQKAELYGLAFDAVWEMDKALNDQIKYISINTKTFKDFTEEDKKQLFDYIGKKYNVTMLDMSIDELKTKGYVKDLYFKDGLVFTVDKYNDYSPSSVSFEGMKWRSGCGAIGFSFQGENKNNKWELKKCGMTWIS